MVNERFTSQTCQIQGEAICKKRLAGNLNFRCFIFISNLQLSLRGLRNDTTTYRLLDENVLFPTIKIIEEVGKVLYHQNIYAYVVPDAKIFRYV